LTCSESSADYDLILPLCEREGLWVLSDAAQSFGGSYRGRRLGRFGLATATSFFPAKPLGCYGDGGAIFTDDADLASVLRSLRIHGQGNDKYDNVRIGMNGRLDTIQAAVLLEKLKIFEDEIARRNAIADRYAAGLRAAVVVPAVPDGLVSTWAQYTIKVQPERRDDLAAKLRDQGHPDRDLLPKAASSADGLSTLPGPGKRVTGVGQARRRSHFAPHAPLSR
jgi:dTDP-4-amino-4,6-dideoxygalactose transaminase